MTAPTRYRVGDRVIVTRESYERLHDASRNCTRAGSFDQTFVSAVFGLIGRIGEVTHTFPPGYEVTVRFGNKNFHMKDHWIERIALKDD